MTQKRILIFGISGQDGSYLSEYYLEQQNDVIVNGVVRRIDHNLNISHLEKYKHSRLILHLGDITDPLCVQSIIKNVQPHIIYNFAGQTNVHTSFVHPIYTLQTNIYGPLNILEAVKNLNLIQMTSIFHASTSQMFGALEKGIILTEQSTMKPESPYAVSKISAFDCIKVYRKAYNMKISTAISFNHESPRRGQQFVTRKITKYIAREAFNLNDSPLQLGNLNSYRDWGHSKDFVKAFKSIMELETSQDFIVSTGVSHNVRQLVELAFKQIDIVIRWEGSGLNQKGFCNKTNKQLIVINQKYFRPNQVPYLQGNSQKIHKRTGWKSEITFQSMIKQMIKEDLKQIKKQNEI